MQRLLEVLKRLSKVLPRLSGGKMLPGNAMSNLTDPRFEPHASRFRDKCGTARLTGRYHFVVQLNSAIVICLDPDPDSGQWFHISDTIVTKVSAAKALKCNAYLIFYERLNRAPPR